MTNALITVNKTLKARAASVVVTSDRGTFAAAAALRSYCWEITAWPDDDRPEQERFRRATAAANAAAIGAYLEIACSSRAGAVGTNVNEVA